jgi:hypothetical protein
VFISTVSGERGFGSARSSVADRRKNVASSPVRDDDVNPLTVSKEQEACPTEDEVPTEDEQWSPL